MNDENECYINAKNGLALFEYLIAMMATKLMLIIRLRYCKYMANINYLSICIFQATVTNLVERALPN